MGRKLGQHIPGLQETLKSLGENIRLARLRRRISSPMMAQRAGMSRTTLRSIERGEGNATLRAYANVLFCLGLEKDLLLIAHDDPLGRKLQDAGLPQPNKRISRRS